MGRDCVKAHLDAGEAQLRTHFQAQPAIKMRARRLQEFVSCSLRLRLVQVFTQPRSVAAAGAGRRQRPLYRSRRCIRSLASRNSFVTSRLARSALSTRNTQARSTKVVTCCSALSTTCWTCRKSKRGGMNSATKISTSGGWYVPVSACSSCVPRKGRYQYRVIRASRGQSFVETLGRLSRSFSMC